MKRFGIVIYSHYIAFEKILYDLLFYFQSMTGFLVITTKNGKLLYISENVTQFLGHSMVRIMYFLNLRTSLCVLVIVLAMFTLSFLSVHGKHFFKIIFRNSKKFASEFLRILFGNECFLCITCYYNICI